MIDFTVPAEIKGILDGLRRFIALEVTPLEQEHADVLNDPRKLYDEKGLLVPAILEARRRLRSKSAEAGYYSMFIPEELGGGGLREIAAFFVWEFLYKELGALSPLVEAQVVPRFVDAPTAAYLGIREAMRPHVQRLVSGEATSCFALSEPGAGSDVWAITTRAVRDADDWVINGRKQWISNAPYADYALLFAVTEAELVRQHKGGITCFLVGTRDGGFEVESVTPIMGHLGSDHGVVNLDGLRVSGEHVVGEENDGFMAAMAGINIGRIVNGARCLGVAEWAFLKALDYSKERVTFGVPLSEHQAIQFMLADCAIEIACARSLGLRAAWKAERNGRSALKDVCMVKAYCVEASQRVIDTAMQIHGGMGLANELRLEEAWKFVRTLRIPDGSSEMQRRTIARQLLRGDLDL
nr:acyl-CoA dehydrogenase [Anaerolineae bacterium]